MFEMKLIEPQQMQGNEYAFENDHPIYEVSKRGEKAAYISGYQNQGEFQLVMIEVIEKERGTGTELINWLFKAMSLERIYGFVLKEERSYYFWESLGAEIDLLEEGFTVDELVREGLQSSFMLFADR